MDYFTRVLDTLSVGDNSLSGLSQRLEAARNTPCSLSEFRSLSKVFAKLSGDGGLAAHNANIAKGRMERLVESVCADLDIANLSAFDEKPGTRLPIGLSVYDAINMATEAATHMGVPSLSLHGWVGSRLTQNYDLEGLDLEVPDPRPFYLLTEQEQLQVASLN